MRDKLKVLEIEKQSEELERHLEMEVRGWQTNRLSREEPNEEDRRKEN